ncbi:MAG: hypothetical protein M1834_009372 [Cirrosporium novae-zelandiae]|nr:MAG: hypothetical protein M1834_009372 [Cirrosporium novae-zelandiae]
MEPNTPLAKTLAKVLPTEGNPRAEDQTTNKAAGTSHTAKSTILDTGASMVQDFSPVNQVCAFLNAFHVYARDPDVVVEANHYCSHLNEDVRQCLIYDSPTPPSRLIGIEYMITPRLFRTLPLPERRLWHSHIFEVKSGMLVMPLPPKTPTSKLASIVMPAAAWDTAETSEMYDVIELYGKTFHLWRVDRDDRVPMGFPELMGSIRTQEEWESLDMNKRIRERDRRFRVDTEKKREIRKEIPEPVLEEGVDGFWEDVKSDKGKGRSTRFDSGAWGEGGRRWSGDVDDGLFLGAQSSVFTEE